MNKIFKYIGCTLMALVALTACSPDEFKGADPNGLPTVDGKTISVETHQETNTAVFAINGDLTGSHPVWYLDGKMYSLLPKTSYSDMSEGTHTLEVRIMNRNGISQGSLTGSFTFNETKVDYTSYFNKLCGKEWRIDYAETGHMGCGEPGTDGSNWWSAGPNDKKDWGVYDDRISFAHSSSDGIASGSYTYNPGEGGTVYVNKGCTIFPEFNTHDDQDFMATVSPQNSTFELIPGTFNEKECLYIKFAPQTLLPYIPYDDSYNNPYFRVEALTNTRLALVCDDGTISWRMVFTSREDGGMPDDPVGPTDVFDWNYDSSSNLWKAVDEGSALKEIGTWFADNSWNDAAVTQPTINHDGDVYSFTVPEGTGSSQWQGQVKIHTTLTAQLAKAYNFYCLVDADNDVPGFTIKLTESDYSDQDKRDKNHYFDGRHAIKADKQFVYKAEGVTLKTDNAHALSLVLDCGGAPAGTNIRISKIYFEEAGSAVSYDDPANMWKAVDEGSAFIQTTTWFADNSWNDKAVTQPTITHNGDTWEFDIPEKTGASQWQGQVAIKTTLTAEMASEYNFSCTLLADNDCPEVTIKLVETDYSDNDKCDKNFFTDARHDITADQPFVYKFKGLKLPKNDAHAISLVLDFGGSPAGTHVKLSNIIFAKNN